MIRNREETDEEKGYKRARREEQPTTHPTHIKKVISLTNESIRTISPEIYNNPVLEKLYISMNSPVIELPEELSRLAPSLLTFSINSSKIENLQPIFQLTQLRTLSLTRVSINQIPDEIGMLTHLDFLTLDSTGISTLPDTVSNIQSLRFLFLNMNQFVSIPECICKLKNLVNLKMTYNKIITIPECISQLTKLHTLDLNRNEIMDISPIKNLNNLKMLLLNHNLIEVIPDTIQTLQNLNHLNVAGNNLREIPDSVANLRKLQYIYAESNAIHKISDNLTKLHLLSDFNLSDNLLNTVPYEFHFRNPYVNLLDNPIMSNYDDYKQTFDDSIDLTFDAFNMMMNHFIDKQDTIYNKKNGYIRDALLKDQTNPYVVHYEEFEGRSYPVITILKGTLLFTARGVYPLPPNLSESYFHLYKLHGNPTLNDYQENDNEKVFTYFFPVPFMSPIVDTDYTIMDVVVLTKDVKLLCMISPSPITRGEKKLEDENLVNNDNLPYYEGTNMKECPSRDYDLCLSTKLVNGLKLNGYIAIAYSDSLSHPENKDIIDEMTDNIEFKKSLLYLCSCFNNATYKTPDQVKGRTFFERMMNARTIGIPEVVLIPYDYHRYSESAEYENVYKDCLQMVQEKRNSIDDSHFIFKYVDHVDGADSFNIGVKMERLLKEFYGELAISKSLQAYPLFTIWNSEFDPEKRDMVVFVNDPVDVKDVSFPLSYYEIPQSKCAFEIVKFYEMMEENSRNQSLRGGRTIQSESRNTNIVLSNKLELPNKIEPYNNKYKKMNIGQLGIRVQPKNMKYVSDRVFYSEAGNIPIFAFKRIKKADENKKMGGNKKTKKRRKNKRMNVKKKTKKRARYSKSKK